MKVFFIIPPEKGIVDKPTSPQRGIACLAAVVRENKHDVAILDMRLGYNRKDMLDKVKEFNADLVCITTVTTDHKKVYEMVDLLKEKGFKVALGGPHVSAFKKKVIEDTKADYAVKREGEGALVKLCNGEDPKTIKGIIYRNNSEVVENEDDTFVREPDEMSFPAFDLFELDKYIDRKLPIITSRGCPYRCTFCSINLTSGFMFRPRSAKNVVDELEHWYKKGYKYFGFNDDNFTLLPERAEEICDQIVERGMKIKWELRNGIRIDKVNERLLRKMKNAGCMYVAFGVESADQEVLDNIKKGITAEKAKEAILLADKVGIKKGAFFIVGLPGDTYKKFLKTLKWALELPLDEVRFYNAVPYPATDFYKWVEENARWIISPDVYMNSIGSFDDQPIFETDDFTKEERIKATKVSQAHMMKYLMKREFGSVLGEIGYWAWKPEFTRKYVFNVGKKMWTMLRVLKTRMSSS